MLNLSDFFTPDEVRATLGVSDEELADDTLDLDMYPRHLGIELSAIDGSLPDLLYTLTALPSPTATESRLVDLIKQTALYITAVQLADSLPVFSPRSITDGKAGTIRHQDSYKDTVERLQVRLAQYAERLKAAITSHNNTSAPLVLPTMLAVSRPSYDPVTGQ